MNKKQKTKLMLISHVNIIMHKYVNIETVESGTVSQLYAQCIHVSIKLKTQHSRGCTFLSDNYNLPSCKLMVNNATGGHQSFWGFENKNTQS